MTSRTRVFFVLMLAVTVVAAALAGWLGVRYGMHKGDTDLDTLAHTRLNLTQDEEGRIKTLEAGFAKRRASYQVEMDAANRDLARALTQDRAFGLREGHAVDRFHKAMMALQEDTIRHVLAMRAVLSPDQAKMFDELVAKDLTQTSP